MQYEFVSFDRWSLLLRFESWLTSHSVHSSICFHSTDDDFNVMRLWEWRNAITMNEAHLTAALINMPTIFTFLFAILLAVICGYFACLVFGWWRFARWWWWCTVATVFVCIAGGSSSSSRFIGHQQLLTRIDERTIQFINTCQFGWCGVETCGHRC